jgi:hypothetical protein
VKLVLAGDQSWIGGNALTFIEGSVEIQTAAWIYDAMTRPTSAKSGLTSNRMRKFSMTRFLPGAVLLAILCGPPPASAQPAAD